MMGEVSLETSPKNIMIQDMINSENSMNTTESTHTDIFMISKEQYEASTLSECRKLEKTELNYAKYTNLLYSLRCRHNNLIPIPNDLYIKPKLQDQKVARF